MTIHRVTIRTWTSSDLDILHRLNSPAMTEHLGGPESEAKVVDRLARYVAASGDTQMFVIEADAGVPAGGIGYWPREWQGSQQFETGWGVLPEHQGKGIATAAIGLLVQHAQAQQLAARLHAFPDVQNVASNALCRKAGFTLLGPANFQYPPGNPISVNDWALDVRAASAG